MKLTKLKKTRTALLLGLGMALTMTSGASSANNPWEVCLLDCFARYQTCIKAGTDSTLCARNRTLCRWQCGKPM